jgi:hypothetical protein
MADAADQANQAAIAQAMARAETNARALQVYYKAHIGVPAGSVGEHENTPLALPPDPAVTGVGGGR